MLFGELRKISDARRQHLPFIGTLEDLDILVAIGEADERGNPLGHKQLALLRLTSPSTLQRRLNRLVAEGTVKKVVQRGDGRRIAYSLSRNTQRAYERFMRYLNGGSDAG